MDIALSNLPQMVLMPAEHVNDAHITGQTFPDYNYASDSMGPGELQFIFSDQAAGSAMGHNFSLVSGPALDVSSGPSSMSQYNTPMVQPKILYNPMPWPDDMLGSSKKRFLWHHYIYSVQADILPLDLEDLVHLREFQDPYTTILPRIALGNTVLRGVLLCASAFQLHVSHRRQDFEAVSKVVGRQVVQALQAQVTNPQGDDLSVLNMMFAASFLHCFGPEQRDYCLQLAAGFAVALLARPRSQLAVPKACLEMNLTAFRWSMISTLCSLRKPKSPFPRRICRVIEMDRDEINTNFSPTFRNWVSHPLYVFSPRLVNPLLRIGSLLELQLLQHDGSDDDDINESEPTLDDEIEEVEDMLLGAREADVNLAASPFGVADPKCVLALNEAMHAASVILVYARLKGMPATAPLIRRQVRIVTDEIAKIGVHSRVSQAIVFPLFIAGCEAVDSQARDVIESRFLIPKGLVFDRGDLVGALHHIWGIRDLEPGLSWPFWAKKGMLVIKF